MMKPFLIVFFIPVHLLFYVSLAVSQESQLPGERDQGAVQRESKVESDREREVREVVEYAMERNIDQLFEGISTRDKGSYSLIFGVGSHSRAYGRANNLMTQVLADVRAIKLRELLAGMPKDEAAQRIKEEFETKLSEFKSGFDYWFEPNRKEWKLDVFDGLPSAHGLAVTLYLSSEFCQHDEFVAMYRSWQNWYRKEAPLHLRLPGKASEQFNQGLISLEDLSIIRSLVSNFEYIAPPDRLFFINLCGVRALRRGVEFETLQEWLKALNEEIDVAFPEFILLETNRFDPVKNKASKEKIRIPLIRDYGEASMLDEMMGWMSNGEIREGYRKQGDQAVLIAIQWSQPNFITRFVRKANKALMEWIAERFDWPTENKSEKNLK